MNQEPRHTPTPEEIKAATEDIRKKWRGGVQPGSGSRATKPLSKRATNTTKQLRNGRGQMEE